MEQLSLPQAPVRSALFVDFDNIFIGLSKTDPQAAERFASDPARWLSWLERGFPLPDGKKTAQPRSILIRRCYPNPDAGFRRFRSFFTSAAFSVIDCPSLTRMGKNSSDIYMVMDILDLLNHKTHFDEFIIFSGDSDFMPVLLRLRAHDRRTTTLGIDFMPPSYKAACDLVISEEDFIEDALGFSSESSSAGNAGGRLRIPMHLMKEMAERVYKTACDDGEVAGADLPDILKDFREFRESTNWLGYGTSQRLAEALVCAEPRLQLMRINATMYKLSLKPAPVKVSTPAVKEKAQHAEKTRGEKPGKNGSEKPVEKPVHERGEKESASGVPAGGKAGKVDQPRLRAQVLAIVKEFVTSSRSAVLLARVSQQVVNKLGPQVLETQWAGAGSFKRLLMQSAADLGLEITTQPEPGYLFDPQRHEHPAHRSLPAEVRGEDAAESPADLETPEEGPGRSLTAEFPVEEEPAGMPVLEALPTDNHSTLVEVSYDMPESLPGSFEMEETEAEQDYSDEAPPSLEEFIRRVSRVTGAPDLMPSQYALVFQGIVNELQRIAQGHKSYTTYQSSKAVSDWCAEHGSAVSRSDIALIFKGIIFQDGTRFGKQPGSYTERELAEVVCDNIRALCKRSQLELNGYEDRLLEEWIMGDLEVEYLPEEDENAPVQANAEAQEESASDSSSMIDNTDDPQAE